MSLIKGVQVMVRSFPRPSGAPKGRGVTYFYDKLPDTLRGGGVLQPGCVSQEGAPALPRPSDGWRVEAGGGGAACGAPKAGQRRADAPLGLTLAPAAQSSASARGRKPRRRDVFVACGDLAGRVQQPQL